MKKLRKIYEYIGASVSRKIVLFLSCSMFILLLGIVSVFSSASIRSMFLKEVKTQESILSLVYDNYTAYMDSLLNYSLDIRMHSDTLSILDHSEFSEADRINIIKYVQSHLMKRTSVGDLQQFHMDFPELSTGVMCDPESLHSIYFYHIDQKDPEMTEALLDSRRYCSMRYDVLADSHQIRLDRLILGFSGRNPLAISTYILDATYMESQLEALQLETGSGVLITFDGALFYTSPQLHTVEAMIVPEASGEVVTVGETEYYGFTRHQEGSPWRITKLVPVSTVISDHNQIRQVVLAVGLLIWLMAMVLFHVTSTKVTKRLKLLTQMMQTFDIGDNRPIEAFPGKDEISQLSVSFQQMANEIHRRVDYEYKLEITKQKAIVEMLRAQIDPHFLYNSLQTISTQALLAGAEDASDMINDLARIFRYSIKGRDPVELYDELKNTAGYVSLYKARFAERLQVRWQVDESLLNIQVPKLIIIEMLQNSIRYALEASYDQITICIQVRREGSALAISVTDNGPGFPEEILTYLNSYFITASHYDDPHHSGGLSNLFERLRILYPQKVSALAQNEDGAHLTIYLRLEESNP